VSVILILFDSKTGVVVRLCRSVGGMKFLSRCVSAEISDDLKW
jgi:hypothetical protein